MGSFIVVNVILIVINVFTLDKGEGGWWFYWITIFWGIGLLAHFIRVFVLNGKLEDNREEMIQKEMEKLKK